MNTPRIHIADSSLTVPVGANERCFQVSREGWFADRSWSHDELLVVNTEGAEEGDLVVLHGRLPGQVRLGCIVDEQLVGAAGEPCDGSYWRVVGRVVRTLRSSPPFWLSQRVEASERAVTAVSGGTARQLSLFAS